MSQFIAEKKNIIYFYDLPKELVTSVKLAQLLKDLAGYELREPAQFRDCKPHPITGVQLPFTNVMIRVEDQSKVKQIIKAMKYFEITDGTLGAHKWQCRALAFDPELLGSNRDRVNASRNVFVKGINNISAKELDSMFAEYIKKNIAAPEEGKEIVKSAKISLAVDKDGRIKHNGYGFVCFEDPAYAEIALSAGREVFAGMHVERYQPKAPGEIRKVYNNIYVKNYPATWTEADLKELFSKYGEIKSLVQMTKQGKDGVEKPFAFVCYDKEGDRMYGPACADAAVKDLHEKEYDDLKIYVQPAIPKSKLRQDIQRFKNSKKRCNLFVKNFP